MSNIKIINYPEMKVIMRKDFSYHFSAHFENITKETGATYFGHNFIKNYREKGHTISTFCNKEEWHELYWSKYRNDDPLEKICHQSVQKSNFAAVSWSIESDISPCCQQRMKLTKTSDGLTFSFKRKENYNETFIFGWDKLKTDRLDADYIFHLASLLKPLRDYHWEVHDKV
ncbi:MAG: hypothetical protein H0X26_03340 [Alphaproteobacteria bacterium]|nr:hypothetical protein [Alphaproteobacteria bacterium]